MENNDFNENSYSRFALNDVGIRNEENEIFTGEDLIEYLKNKREKLVQIKEKLEVGYIVKLRFTGDVVVIEKVGCDPFEYKGKVVFTDDVLCFNQIDVEQVMGRKTLNK